MKNTLPSGITKQLFRLFFRVIAALLVFSLVTTISPPIFRVIGALLLQSLDIDVSESARALRNLTAAVQLLSLVAGCIAVAKVDEKIRDYTAKQALKNAAEEK